jgi:hypothetical protein
MRATCLVHLILLGFIILQRHCLHCSAWRQNQRGQSQVYPMHINEYFKFRNVNISSHRLIWVLVSRALVFTRSNVLKCVDCRRNEVILRRWRPGLQTCRSIPWLTEGMPIWMGFSDSEFEARRKQREERNSQIWRYIIASYAKVSRLAKSRHHMKPSSLRRNWNICCQYLIFNIHWIAIMSRVEAGRNTSTVALRVARGDGKGTQCPGVYPGHPVLGGNK